MLLARPAGRPAQLPAEGAGSSALRWRCSASGPGPPVRWLVAAPRREPAARMRWCAILRTPATDRLPRLHRGKPVARSVVLLVSEHRVQLVRIREEARADGRRGPRLPAGFAPPGALRLLRHLPETVSRPGSGDRGPRPSRNSQRDNVRKLSMQSEGDRPATPNRRPALPRPRACSWVAPHGQSRRCRSHSPADGGGRRLRRAFAWKAVGAEGTSSRSRPTRGSTRRCSARARTTSAPRTRAPR